MHWVCHAVGSNNFQLPIYIRKAKNWGGSKYRAKVEHLAPSFLQCSVHIKDKSSLPGISQLEDNFVTTDTGPSVKLST